MLPLLPLSKKGSEARRIELEIKNRNTALAPTKEFPGF